MAEFEQFTLQLAIAPTRVCLGQAQQEFLVLRIGCWPTSFVSLAAGLQDSYGELLPARHVRCLAWGAACRESAPPGPRRRGGGIVLAAGGLLYGVLPQA